MKANVGSIDRAARILAGVALIAMAVTGIAGPWGWIGIVPLVTGIFRICPAYFLFGISSCRTGH